jgi:glycyl-tRNA synthetase beta chain
MAERIDILAQFFGHDMKPSGSKDPFALRRAALSLLQLVFANQVRVGIFGVFTRQMDIGGPRVRELVSDEIVSFLIDRLKVQQREAGVRHDLIDAVFALGGEDDLVRLLARVKALRAFVATPDGANLLAGYKRAANILRKEGWDTSAAASSAVIPAKAGIHRAAGAGGETDSGIRRNDGEGAERSPERAGDSREGAQGRKEGAGGDRLSLSYTPEKEEAALIAALDAAEPAAEDAVEREDFEGAMTALSTLRAPIDAFFDKVTVNDPEAGKRAARLALLGRVRDAVHRVADFSKIEG